jgi:hypothetical protein
MTNGVEKSVSLVGRDSVRVCLVPHQAEMASIPVRSRPMVRVWTSKVPS